MSGTLQQYLGLIEQAKELEPGHWLANTDELEDSDVSELLETGSLTVKLGGKEWVISLQAQEAPTLQLSAVWNTNRHYTAHGQVIAAVATPVNRWKHAERVYEVTFKDASRHITGVFETLEGELVAWGLAKLVLTTYDLNEWKDIIPKPDLEQKLNQMVTEHILEQIRKAG